MEKTKFCLMLLLVVLSPLFDIGEAATYKETQQNYIKMIADAEREIIIAVDEVSRLKKIPPFRDSALERNRKGKIIYWSQKFVSMENSIFEYRKKISELGELSRYHEE